MLGRPKPDRELVVPVRIPLIMYFKKLTVTMWDRGLCRAIIISGFYSNTLFLLTPIFSGCLITLPYLYISIIVDSLLYYRIQCDGIGKNYPSITHC